MPTIHERRKYIRIPEAAQITYEVISDKKIRESVTKDLSQGGIRFLVHYFTPKDSHLKIKISFSKVSFSFEAIVRLVWIREIHYSGEYEVGAEFIDIPEKAKEHLIGYIKSFEHKE